MYVPNADEVESGLDMCRDEAYQVRHKLMLDAQVENLKAGAPAQSVEDTFVLGYNLGCETFRFILREKGITIGGIEF